MDVSRDSDNLSSNVIKKRSEVFQKISFYVLT